MKDHVGV